MSWSCLYWWEYLSVSHCKISELTKNNKKTPRKSSKQQAVLYLQLQPSLPALRKATPQFAVKLGQLLIHTAHLHIHWEVCSSPLCVSEEPAVRFPEHIQGWSWGLDGPTGAGAMGLHHGAGAGAGPAQHLWVCSGSGPPMIFLSPSGWGQLHEENYTVCRGLLQLCFSLWVGGKATGSGGQALSHLPPIWWQSLPLRGSLPASHAIFHIFHSWWAGVCARW